MKLRIALMAATAVGMALVPASSFASGWQRGGTRFSISVGSPGFGFGFSNYYPHRYVRRYYAPAYYYAPPVYYSPPVYCDSYDYCPPVVYDSYPSVSFGFSFGGGGHRGFDRHDFGHSRGFRRR